MLQDSLRKIVPSRSLYGKPSGGEAAAYMRDGHYVLVSGSRQFQSDTEIQELLAPVPEVYSANAKAILAYNAGSKPYHPIPIQTFHGVEVSRPSVDRYNIAYGALASCGAIEGRTMCELGCHTGYLSFSFECCGLAVTAYDIGTGVINIAEHTAKILNSKVRFHQADIRDVVKRGWDYDYVLGMNVFHHLTPDFSHDELREFVVSLGAMTRKAAVVTTLEADDLTYTEIAELGGFTTVEKVGEPVDSYPIWLLSKG